MINKLIQLTVETGLFTGTPHPALPHIGDRPLITACVAAALAIVQVSLYVSFRDTEYFMTPAGALSKAYSNSLLVLLNNRRVMRDAREKVSNSLSLPQLQTTRAIQINVNQETFAEGNLAMDSEDKVRRSPSAHALSTQSSDGPQFDEFPKVADRP